MRMVRNLIDGSELDVQADVPDGIIGVPRSHAVYESFGRRVLMVSGPATNAREFVTGMGDVTFTESYSLDLGTLTLGEDYLHVDSPLPTLRRMWGLWEGAASSVWAHYVENPNAPFDLQAAVLDLYTGFSIEESDRGVSLLSRSTSNVLVERTPLWFASLAFDGWASCDIFPMSDFQLERLPDWTGTPVGGDRELFAGDTKHDDDGRHQTVVHLVTPSALVTVTGTGDRPADEITDLASSLAVHWRGPTVTASAFDSRGRERST